MCGKVKEMNTFQQDLSTSFALSEKEILKIFRKCNEVRKQIVYFNILSEAKSSIINGDISLLLKTNALLSRMRNEVSALRFLVYRCSPNNPLRNVNIIVLACKSSQPEILDIILGDKCNIIQHWPITVGYDAVLPTDIDEYCHNAFYYAIRSGRTKNVEILIEKWPDEYPFQNSGKLHEALSNAYGELKLKNVKLPIEMEVFVRSVLFEKDFFDDCPTPEPDEPKKKSNKNDKAEIQKAVDQYKSEIENRIKLVLSNISTLTKDFAIIDVDDTFLIIAKFIAKNIHILKSQLKCTYDKIPWEETEFCLVIFILTMTELKENHLIHARILSKNRILMHLNNFSSCLENALAIINQTKIVLYKLPVLKEAGKNIRESCALRIIEINPLLKELYKDYDRIRDEYSLKIMKPYLNLAISAKCDSEGKLLITRALQVVGEYIKNTLESPKLSDTTCEYLLVSLPRNTREIIKSLRDSISHAESMGIRVEIEKHSEMFFNRVQDDLKKLITAIFEVLCQGKIRVVRDELKEISDCENEEELKEILKSLHFENATEEHLEEIPEISLLKVMQTQVEDISLYIKTKTPKEISLFEKINDEIVSEMNRLEQIKRRVLKDVNSYNCFVKKCQNDLLKFENIKIEAKRLLNETSPKIVWARKNYMLILLLKILKCVSLKFCGKELAKLMFLFYKLFNSAAFEMSELKLIEEYKGDITENKLKIRTKPILQTGIVDKLLFQKLSQLKNMLDNNTFKDFNTFKSNRNHQVVVEMLVLDIYSLLDEDLSFNPLFLDEEPVTFIGRNMRNHLAHENTLIHISSHALIDLSLNAQQMLQELSSNNRRKIGNTLQCNINKIQIEHDQDLDIIALQKEMFMALFNGDLKKFRTSITKGADVKARYMGHKTALHIACQGTSIEILKLILAENGELVTKDEDGQSALHIAALHGRSNIIEYLIKNTNTFVDQLDKHRKTPLHIASEQGCLEIVNILLQFGASTTQEDKSGYTPLHYSVQNNHEDIVIALLNTQDNVDENEAFVGWTPLHIASSRGHLRLVKYLIGKGANVNAASDTLDVPLHIAVQYGHLDIVRTLIENGANVSARNMYGLLPLHVVCQTGQETILHHLMEKDKNVDDILNIFRRSPLSFAAEHGNLEIVKLLLKRTAKVDLKDVTGKTPLHFASKNGKTSIVEILIENNASLDVADRTGSTALHYSACYGHASVVTLLVEHVDSINCVDKSISTPLMLAVSNGHLDVTKILIDKKAEVNKVDRLKSTALHVCCEKQFLDIAKLLIESKADFHVPSLQFGLTPFHMALGLCSKAMLKAFEDGGANVKDIKISDFTALHLATVNGDLELIQYLIDSGCDVNAKSKSGLTALHLAILEHNNMNVIELLVKSKSNLDIRDQDGFTPLKLAVQVNNKIILQYLIKNGAKLEDKNYGDILESSVLLGNCDMVTILLDAVSFDVNVKLRNNSNLLLVAVSYGHKKVAEILLDKGADINGKPGNFAPLFEAAVRGNFEISKLLLEKGADPNITSTEKQVTPLYAAVREGYTDIVDILLQKGAKKVNSTNKSPLQLAVEYSRVEVVKFLLDNEHGDVNEITSEQLTLLQIAAMKTNLEIVKFLVEKGADYNAKDVNGMTPLVMAAASGQKDIAEYLHQFGAKDILEQMALMFAVRNGHLEVTKYLVKNGVDVNSSVNDSETFLHLAAVCNQKYILRYFLSNGAYYNVLNRNRKTPLYFTKDLDIKCTLELVEQLFVSIKRNEPVVLEDAIRKGAILDAKRKDNAAPLHYAAWKGHCNIVSALLKSGANPNIIGKSNSTPLHYAAEFGHFDIVRSLLSHGAIYNIQTDAGKIPLDNSTNKDVTELLSLVDKSFRRVQVCNSDFLEDLKALKDPKTIKSVMKSRNKDNKLLVNFAIIHDFPKIYELKSILKVDTDSMYEKATEFVILRKYSESLKLFENILKIRTEVLGHDYPDTLDIKDKIGEVLLKQKDFDKALNIFDGNFKTKQESLGDNSVSTLHTKRYLAITLHKLEQKSEARRLIQEVYTQQSKIFGERHQDVLETQTEIANMLEEEDKDEEALAHLKTVYNFHSESNGESHPKSLSIQADIAKILCKQNKHDEAIKKLHNLYEYAQKLIKGENNQSTLEILSKIAKVYFMEDSCNKALKIYKTVLEIQKAPFGTDDISVLTTLYEFGSVLFSQQKVIEAFKVFSKCEKGLKMVASNHAFTPTAQEMMELIKYMFSVQYGVGECCILEQIENSSTEVGLEDRIREASVIYLKRLKPFPLYPVNWHTPEKWPRNPEEVTKEDVIDLIAETSKFRPEDERTGTETLSTFEDRDVFHGITGIKEMNSGIHMKFDDTGCA